MHISPESTQHVLASARERIAVLLAESDVPNSGTADGARRALFDVLSTLASSSKTDAKSLVSDMRQQGLCTLEEAHVLISLDSAASNSSTANSIPGLISECLSVVEKIAHTALQKTVSDSLKNEYRGIPNSVSPSPRDITNISHLAASKSSNGSTSFPPLDIPAPSSSGRSSAFVIGLVVVCLIAAGLAAFLLSGVSTKSALEEGIAAYESGRRAEARVAFERALEEQPSDALPLVYMGRLSREEGNMSSARKYLEQAVQLNPGLAVAHRELASALLSDGENELARRFYVRALTIDSEDRLSQGFLACALFRLGREEEAERWALRAGTGDWNTCVSASSNTR